MWSLILPFKSPWLRLTLILICSILLFPFAVPGLPLHPPTLKSAETDFFSPWHPPTLKSAETDFFSPWHPPTLKSAETDFFSPWHPPALESYCTHPPQAIDPLHLRGNGYPDRLFSRATDSSSQGSDKPSFRLALPGYEYRFPWDHGSHEEFQTEWWYYTGHLLSADKQRYGYQLTFFRRAIASKSVNNNPSRWAIRNIYFAHFAITDEGRDAFHVAEKISREGLGKAGATTGRLAVWIDQWRAQDGVAGHLLHAGEKGQAIDLELVAEKPPIVHGSNGVTRKGDAETEASHYYSLTRMKTVGTLILNGRVIPVTGLSWMDHEFGSNQLSTEQVGWDWFSVQLNDLSELMLYQIRRRDGSVEPSSAGTWITQDGTGIALKREDVRVEILADWRSPKTGARYPSQWRISIPRIGLVVELTPTISDQELLTPLSTQVTYWEGSVTAKGTRRDQSVSGDGYVELTGYASELRRRL